MVRPMIRAAALALALALAWSAPAGATQDGWPALFDVTGVAANDVLNIRAAPSASARILGGLAPHARGVEVIRPDPRQNWGLVNTREGTGWVSLRFLARRPGQWDGAFPEVASCRGTEPFWALSRSAGRLSLSTPEETTRFGEDWTAGSLSRRDRFAFGSAGGLTAVILREECSDGMSDRVYGLAVELLVDEGYGPQLFSGCCSLAP